VPGFDIWQKNAANDQHSTKICSVCNGGEEMKNRLPLERFKVVELATVVGPAVPARPVLD